MTIAVIILSIAVVALLIYMMRLRRQAYFDGCHNTQKLIDANLEFLNLQFWWCNLADNTLGGTEKMPLKSRNGIESIAELFESDIRKDFTDKVEKLRKGESQLTKFCGMISPKIIAEPTYAYISMSMHNGYDNKPIITGTFSRTPENIFEYFKSIPSFANFKTMFEEVPMGVILCDKDGYVENLNKQALTIFGIENKNSFLSKNPNINNDPFYKGPKAEVLKETKHFVMIEEYDFNANPRCNRTGKATIHYTAKIVTDLKGIDHIFITVTDISSNILFNDRFGSLFANAKTLLKMAPVGVTIFDQEGGRIFVNDEFVSEMGIRDVTAFMRKRQKIWEVPTLGQYFQDQITKYNVAQCVVTVDFTKPVVKEFFGSSLHEVKHFRIDYRKITNPDGKCPTYIITSLDLSKLEKEQHKNSLLTKQCETLIELGNFIPFIYNTRTRKKAYLCNTKQFPNLPEVEDLPNKILVRDFAALSRGIMQVADHETDSARIIVNYKKDNDYTEPWEMIIKSLQNDEILCVAHNISHIIKPSPIVEPVAQPEPMVELPQIKPISFFPKTGIIKSDGIEYDFHTLLKYINLNGYDDVQMLKDGVNANLKYEGIITSDNTVRRFYVNFSPLKYSDDGQTVVEYTGAFATNNEHQLIFGQNVTSSLLPVIINNLPCMFYIKDVQNDFRYVIANDKYSRAINMLPIELIGKNDFSFMGITPESLKFREDDNKAIKFGTYEFDDFTSYNNKKISWRIQKSYVKTRDNHEYIVSTALDITELVRAKENYEEAQRAADHARTIQTSFLNNINHEIRTPLNAIVGFSQLLIEEEDMGKKKYFSSIVYQKGMKLANSISNILEISKLQTGDINLNITEFDVSIMLEELYNQYYEKNNPQVIFELKKQFSHFNISADRAKIMQIIENYIQNAINNTSSGKITIGYDIERNNLKLYVSDTGKGIKEEDQAKIFIPFEKLDTFGEGLGLGLTISKAMSQAMNAKVGFSSQFGTGSTFWLLFPLNNAKYDKKAVAEHPTNYPL